MINENLFWIDSLYKLYIGLSLLCFVAEQKTYLLMMHQFIYW